MQRNVIYPAIYETLHLGHIVQNPLNSLLQSYIRGEVHRNPLATETCHHGV